MPEGCATWPSWWLTQNQPGAPGWPIGGEIDVIEGANTQLKNRMTLHTGGYNGAQQCDMFNEEGKDNGVVFNGTLKGDQMICDAGGCAIDDRNPTTFGTGFNSLSVGGTYAMEWTPDHIKMWFLPRSIYPGRTENPNPGCWPMPVAWFNMTSDSDCKPSNDFFFGQSMVLNTDFCGAWAGGTFNSECGAGSCMDYISSHHQLLNDTAFWFIESIAVYTNDGTGFGQCPTTSTSATATSATTKAATTGSTTKSATTGSTTKAATTGSTSTSGSTTSSSNPLSAAYIGCRVDSANRDLPNHCPDNPTSLTNEKCRYFCGVRGFAFAGTQSGYQCWCGPSEGGQGNAPETDCSVVCPGNANEKCGGAYRNSVYSAGNAGYLGCYVDSATRVFDVQIYQGVQLMYVDMCRQGCASQGYTYSGLQYGNECWCGHAYNTQGAAPASDCNMPCSGDNTFMCGAGYRNSVYTSQLPAGYDYY